MMKNKNNVARESKRNRCPQRVATVSRNYKLQIFIKFFSGGNLAQNIIENTSKIFMKFI